MKKMTFKQTNLNNVFKTPEKLNAFIQSSKNEPYWLFKDKEGQFKLLKYGDIPTVGRPFKFYVDQCPCDFSFPIIEIISGTLVELEAWSPKADEQGDLYIEGFDCVEIEVLEITELKLKKEISQLKKRIKLKKLQLESLSKEKEYVSS